MTERPRPKILVISPLYFPTEEGLAHYTTEFCRHLAKSAEVAVLTGAENGELEHGPGRVKVLGLVRRWTFLGPARALRKALLFEPDRVLIQFVPFMYSRRGGINFTIVALAAALALRAQRRGRGEVQVMFHELWYPFAWRPKDATMHVLHRGMVLGLSLVAREVFCSTSRFAAQVRRNAGPFRSRAQVLVVGSNLERDEQRLRAVEPVSDGVVRVAIFGSLHSSKNVPLVLRAIHDASLRSPRPLRLTVIGLTLEQLTLELPELASWLAAEVEITGPLEARQAAERLAKQDLVVSYFQDGVSARRGSLLAALCEGAPVVTTWRAFSDEVFLDRDFVQLFSCEEDVFRDQLVEFLSSSERPFAGVARKDVRRFYDEHFSWSAVITRYLELSSFQGRAPRGESSPSRFRKIG